MSEFNGISNPGLKGLWVPVATAERVAAQRDHYKAALREIAALGDGLRPLHDQYRAPNIAREALGSSKL